MNAVISEPFTIGKFEAGDIEADRFDHEAHVYVAWLYVRAYELPEAISRFDAGLKRLVSKFGAKSKYHATLTWFFLLLINDRSEDGESWSVFRDRNGDIISDSRNILSRYYSEELVLSDRARERFVLPNNLAE